MRIQESLVTDKQIALELFSENGKFRLPIEGQDYFFPTLEKVHEAFLNQDTYDTIKLTHNGKKSYLHLFMDEIEVFDTKKALRKRLSQDSQGMWTEIRNGQKHYYIEQRGWISTSYKEITEKECVEKLQHTSTMTKALGIGLGMLALLPGAVEFARRVPLGTKEAAMGLIALNQKNPVLGAVGYSLLPSKVEAQAMGTEFQVNTYTTGYQALPSIAPLNDGGFVVIWQSSFIERAPWSTPTSSSSSIGQDGDGAGIFGQRYDSNGSPAGTEFQVNTYTTSDQFSPSIAPLNDGGFVVIWNSDGQDGDGYGIFGQRYDSNGIVSGTEFQINTYTTSSQSYPNVASLNDGSIVVTWHSNGQDGDSNGIYGQRYDSNGLPTGTEFQVNTYTTRSQDSPSIAPLNDGGFVVTWQSFGQDGDIYGIFGQRYDSNGVEAGAEFQVNTYTTSYQTNPSVAPLDNGGFVVTWQSSGQDGSYYGIYGRLYNSFGVAGIEFQVNTYTTSHQSGPSVAPLNNGGFVVTWESNDQNGNGWDIFGQRYTSNGNTVGTEFQINTYSTAAARSYSSVAPLNDGGFVITWQSLGQDGDGDGIFGQRYDASGNPIGLQLPISTILTPSPSPIQGSPSQNTPTPSFVTTQSAPTLSTPLLTNTPSATGSTAVPSNTPSPTPMTGGGMPSSTTVPSMGPTSNTLATTNTALTLPSSTTTTNNSPSPTLTISDSTQISSIVSSVTSSSNQVGVSTSSSRSVTSTSVAAMPISSTPVIGSVENIVYEESYPILVNDQVIGSYTVSGGTGLLDSGNPNVIYFEFDPTFQPEEGEVITLFYIPDEEVALWEGIEIEGESIECLEPHGYVDTKLGGSSYQIIFEEATCLNLGPTMLATALPLTLN